MSLKEKLFELTDIKIEKMLDEAIESEKRTITVHYPQSGYSFLKLYIPNQFSIGSDNGLYKSVSINSHASGTVTVEDVEDGVYVVTTEDNGGRQYQDLIVNFYNTEFTLRSNGSVAWQSEI